MTTTSTTHDPDLTPDRAGRYYAKLIPPIAHPVRLAILFFIVNAGRPVTHAEIIAAIGVSPSSLTQHLQAMSSFIVQARKGRSKSCEVDRHHLGIMASMWGRLYRRMVETRPVPDGDASDRA